MKLPQTSKYNNLMLLFFLGGLIIYRLIICFNYTPEISTGETNNIWNALQVANGKALYSNPEDTPFEIFQYTPLSQIPIIGAANLMDSQEDNYYYKVMVVGRLLSLFYNLFTFYLLFVLLKNILNVSKTLSLAATICGFGLLTHLAFAIRPDSLSLLLVITSIFLFSNAYFQQKKNYYVLCGISFAISFFAKQDSFLILSALGLCILLSKRWKDLFVLAFSFSCTFCFLLYVFKGFFGDFFFFSIFGGLSIGYNFEQAHGVFERFLQFYGFFFYTSILFVYLIFRNIIPVKEKFFFICLTLISFFLAISISFKIGSWVNYYTPFITYSILLIYYVVAFFPMHNYTKIIESAMTYITIIIVFVFVIQQIYHYTFPFLKFKESKSQHIEMVNSLKNFKKEANEKEFKIFTFDKKIKLFLFKNTIFPNTEFYHVSKFSVKGYSTLNKINKLSHIIKVKEIDESQFSTLKYYHVPLNEYKGTLNLTKYIIYEHGR